MIVDSGILVGFVCLLVGGMGLSLALISRNLERRINELEGRVTVLENKEIKWRK